MTSGSEIQIDEGNYTRIHHAILEKLAEARLSGAEFRALMFLLRKTYGFKQKESPISLSQWSQATRTARPHVLATLNELVAKKIIIRRADEGQVPWYSFNKYYEEWQGVFEKDSARGARFKVLPEQEPPPEQELLPTQVPVPEQVTVTNTGNESGTCIGNESVTCTGTHKRKKDSKDIFSPAPAALPEKPLSEQQQMFGAIAEVCRLDPKLKAGMIAKNASALLKASYRPEDVLAFRGWWESDPWRMKNVPVPSLADLLNKLPQSREWATRRNGHNREVDRNDWADDPQMVALRRARGEI